MAGWFDQLTEAGKKKFRAHASRMGKKSSVLDKSRAGRIGAEARWKKHKEQKQEAAAT